jgi:hypothetical protein
MLYLPAGRQVCLFLAPVLMQIGRQAKERGDKISGAKAKEREYFSTCIKKKSERRK